MSNGEKASAIFNEYNNTNKGEAFVTTGCTNSTLDAVVNYIDSENVSAVDTVLGRSMDTYSDEMDEIQANQMIEAAIDQYYEKQDKNGMLLFMEVMVTRMQQTGEVVVPYITENPFMSEEQISKVKAGDTISLDHDVRLKIETVKDADEKEWIGVFTSSEEMHKGSAGNVQMNQSIESILRLALNWEQVNGIVINPFGKYIRMTKKMIELLINGYEHYENERKSKDDENN